MKNSLFAISFLLLILISCNKEEITAIKVTDVSLSKMSINLTPGETESLIATVLPTNATNQNLTWSSDQPSIASVVDGKVTAISVGIAIITVNSEEGSIQATCTITVTPISVNGILLNKTSLSMNKGISETLYATIFPSNSTNKKLFWSSDNPSVVTVDGNGMVTSISGGSAVITVTTEDGTFSATCNVTVTIAVTGVSLNKTSLSLTGGQTETLLAIVDPTDATSQNLTWSSDNPTIATVDEYGKVAAISTGTAIITVTTKDGSFKSTCTVTVIDYQQIGVVYPSKWGFDCIINSITITTMGSKMSCTVNYKITNTTTDKVLNPCTVSCKTTSGAYKNQYGFFNKIYPGYSETYGYTFETLVTDPFESLNFTNPFYNETINPNAMSLIWNLQNI